MEKQLIRFAGRKAMKHPVLLGYEGDNLVERLEFDLPEIAAGQTATLMITGADAVKLDRTDEGRYAVDLTRDMIGPDGEREAHVRIDGEGDRVWQSSPMRMITGALPDVEEEIERVYPTAVGQMLTAMAEHSGEMNAQEERIEQAAQRAEEAADELTAPTVTVETLAPGSAASAEWTADGGAPELKLGIPQGSPGKTPVKGVDYFDGEKGEPGQSGVHFGNEMPTDPNVNVWVDLDGEAEYKPWRFELLKSVTIEEDVTEFVWDAAELVALDLEIIGVVAEAAQNLNCYVHTSDGQQYYSYLQNVYETTKVKNTKVYFELHRDGKREMCTVVQEHIDGRNCANTPKVHIAGADNDGVTITKLNVYNNSAPFRAGTVITLRGVRA